MEMGPRLDYYTLGPLLASRAIHCPGDVCARALEATGCQVESVDWEGLQKQVGGREYN